MTKRSRRRYSAEFKAKVALEAIQGERTLADRVFATARAARRH